MNIASQRPSVNTVALTLGVTLCLAACLELSRNLGANWDEYNYLSKVYLLASGQLSQPLQTFHAQLFGWLPNVGTSEIDQIIAARLTIWSVFLGTCVLVYLIGRQFLSNPSAIFSAFSLASFSFVLQHASSFRADTMASFFVLFSAWLVLRQKRLSAIIAGISLSLAFLLTIKSALLMPAWIGLVAWSWIHEGKQNCFEQSRNIFWVAISAGLSGVTLFLLHQSALQGLS
ncbi:glycosyltransferase family 39 protein [Wenzhouxiangella sediminis]|uniref:Uncharacterized protein n=1 Tax=Wenzhouxiangella sediminis TaxID=1792836 RepID=A0A3E1K5D1_9GAMM|nr:glycosyltransferase family 39 protein [Wenzhouxiangella sediminis]RFF28894.1 hypothetical protein DZC52_15045 [Wenzhouxiangella sediminis]